MNRVQSTDSLNYPLAAQTFNKKCAQAIYMQITKLSSRVDFRSEIFYDY